MASLLKKSLAAAEREREDVKEARAVWARWQESIDPAKLVFLDESGIRTNATTGYGWSPRGQRCFGKAPCGWKSYSLLSAISQDEIVEGIVLEGALNKPTFKYFMEELLLPRLAGGSIVVMDNLRVHKNSFNMRKFRKKGIEIIYLPPYSPDLNPIENMWSKVKEMIKKSNPRNLLEIWMAMNNAFFAVTPANLAGWFKHCGYYH